YLNFPEGAFLQKTFQHLLLFLLFLHLKERFCATPSIAFLSKRKVQQKKPLRRAPHPDNQKNHQRNYCIAPLCQTLRHGS
ncbi:MAG: hypothetical protein QME47_07235, partial [Candidatus Thermoplasmatota archaeon]|nr:hypothetical protein [Candidatus Thermoplasmatota archaeon]